ncbi:MAG: histone H1 [Phycisphaerales bacterium]
MEAYEQMKKLIAECDEDVKKAVGGNKAAGTRVRKTMQEIKECAQKVRQDILNLRGPGEGGDE